MVRSSDPLFRPLPDEEVLILLEELELALGRPRGAAPTPAPGAGPSAPTEPPGGRTSDVPAYAPASPYLEERLATARREIARLQAGAREIHEWAGRINELSNATATELRRAADELTFARARGLVDTRPRQAEPPGPRSEGGIPVAPIPAPLSENRDAAALPEERSEGGGPSGRFHAFTVAEYNQSIGALQRRWPWVAGFAVLVGGTISLLLVAIAYDTHAPATSWWLALLPVVWMIPVPFFLLAFRGTRRILRRHDLTLEESS